MTQATFGNESVANSCKARLSKATLSRVTITLDRAPLHTPLTLTASQVEPTLARRLAALGLRRGVALAAVGRTTGGGRVVQVAGARIALDRSVMRSLTVTAA